MNGFPASARIFMLLVTLILTGQELVAQIKKEMILLRPEQSISLNLLGDGSLLSVNYEKLFAIQPEIMLAGKLGVGFNQEFRFCLGGSCSEPPVSFVTFPHHVTALFGKRKNFFEIGMGGTVVPGQNARHYYVYPIAGYRFQPIKTNIFNFRAFVCWPLNAYTDINSDKPEMLFVPLGISFGYCF